ncbi:hypothetical protein KAR10_00610 [bacterium]|nr:hypothetical protein [bacterium]
MNEDQFRRFYYNYYQSPKPQLLKSALEYYCQTYKSDLSGNEQRINKRAMARFFAVLAAGHPQIWRVGEKIFAHASWKQKAVLLEVFKRSQDEQLKNNLSAWVRAEPNIEKRISIEKALIALENPRDILKKPIRDQDRLEEQWAVFFALGNTSVVNASLEFLSPTCSGQICSLTSPGKKIQKALPGEHRLRKHIISNLAKRSRAHPVIRKLLLEQALRSSESEIQRILLNILVPLFLGLQNIESSKSLAPLINQLWDKTPGRIYYQGAIAALEPHAGRAMAAIRKLERTKDVSAERLRGYQAYQEMHSRELLWKQIPVQRSDEEIPQRCYQFLAQAKNLRTVEFWNMEHLPITESPDVYFHQVNMAFSGPDRYFYSNIHAGRIETWFLKNDKAYRYVSRKGVWVEVLNQASQEEVEALNDTGKVRQFLARETPKVIKRLQGPQGKIINVVKYENPENIHLLREAFNVLFPGCHNKIRADFFIDQESGRLLHLQVGMEIFSENNKVAQGKIDRIYYDYDTVNLDWMK